MDFRNCCSNHVTFSRCNTFKEDAQQSRSIEERTLPLLQDSKIDQEIGKERIKKKGGRKHKASWMKRPMAISDVLLEFYDEELRENALRCLSNYLSERRVHEPEKYNMAGFYIYHGCGIMAILLQEITDAYHKMDSGNFNLRASKRLANVLTLFQIVAANKETRSMFVEGNITSVYELSNIPYYLLPFILSESTEEFFENIRAISLSVIGIIIQWREPSIIEWALKSNILDACLLALDTGSELSKVIAMHILESVLQDNNGLSFVCEDMNRLDEILGIFKEQVLAVASDQEYSPRILFHIIRCYILLCRHSRVLDQIRDDLPSSFLDNTFHSVLEEFPAIRQLLHQLLLNVGKSEELVIMGKDCCFASGLNSSFLNKETIKDSVY